MRSILFKLVYVLPNNMFNSQNLYKNLKLRLVIELSSYMILNITID